MVYVKKNMSHDLTFSLSVRTLGGKTRRSLFFICWLLYIFVWHCNFNILMSLPQHPPMDKRISGHFRTVQSRRSLPRSILRGHLEVFLFFFLFYIPSTEHRNPDSEQLFFVSLFLIENGKDVLGHTCPLNKNPRLTSIEPSSLLSRGSPHYNSLRDTIVKTQSRCIRVTDRVMGRWLSVSFYKKLNEI